MRRDFGSEELFRFLCRFESKGAFFMSSRNKWCLTLIAALFSMASVSGCSDESRPQEPVSDRAPKQIDGGIESQQIRAISVSELKQIISSEDEMEIVRAMNRVKQNQESHELMVFIMKLWANDKQEHPDLPWRVINSEIVRIELANVLVQASNNGLIKVDREAIRKYAMQVISGTDQLARATAINTLGLIRNSADLELIKNIALEEDARTFWAAIIALSASCDPRANVMLDDIKKNARRDESKKFLQESYPALMGYKSGCGE
jgi:hypothetical protein